MRTIYWYLHFVFTLVFTIPRLFIAKKKKPTMAPKEFYQMTYGITRDWAQKQLRASGAAFHMTGEENIPQDRAVLFVSNHQGNFDLAIFLGLIPTPKGYIAKSELLKVPLLRTWMTYINCVFMDRRDIRNSARAITSGINIIKSGHSMVVFPEGTRSKGGPVAEFKAGSFKLATKSNAPVVPVTIDGSFRVMEANNNRIVPADVSITIHPPIETADMPREEQLLLPERVRGIICSVLPADYSPIPSGDCSEPRA